VGVLAVGATGLVTTGAGVGVLTDGARDVDLSEVVTPVALLSVSTDSSSAL